MRVLSVFVSLLILFSQTTNAASYSVSLPVDYSRLNGSAELNVTISDYSIVQVNTASFIRLVSDLVSDKTKQRLAETDTPVLDHDLLNKLGFSLSLNKQTLTIELDIAPDSLKRRALNDSSSKALPTPTQSASWAILNNFTINAEKNSDLDTVTYQFNWEGRANVNGSEGWNLDWLVYANKIHDTQLNRGPITLFKEWYELPLRLSLGDVTSLSNGHGTSVPLGGVRIATEYRELQPSYRIAPGNTQSFYLAQNAQIEVLINGETVARDRLRVGNYDLNDLPLANGVSEIEIVADFANGEQQRFFFNTFFNSRLLREGLFEYDFSAGYANDTSSIDYRYQESPGFTGIVNYGVYDWLTAGLNAAYSDSDFTTGITVTAGKSGQSITLRASGSKSDDVSGSALSVSSEHVVWGTTEVGSPNFFLGHDTYKHFLLSPLQSLDFLENRERTYGSYTYFLTDEWDLTVFGEKYESPQREGHRYEAQLNWRYKDFRIALEYSDNKDTLFGNQKGFFLNFSWADYDHQSKRRYRMDYRGRQEEYRGTIGRVNNNRVGQFGYEVEATDSRRNENQTARVNYTSRFGRADVYAIRNAFEGRDSQTYTGINLSSSLAVVDGHIGTGTSVVAPFALINSHSSLGNATVAINQDKEQLPEAIADDFVSGIVTLGTPYTHSEVLIDVVDAPMGYDWGPGGYQHVQGSRAAALITVGSDASYTVLGYFVDKKGKGISLIQGTASLNDTVYSIFTNKAGRFVIEGARPGVYDIQLGPYEGRVNITHPESSLVQVGKITLEQSQ